VGGGWAGGGGGGGSARALMAPLRKHASSTTSDLRRRKHPCLRVRAEVLTPPFTAHTIIATYSQHPQVADAVDMYSLTPVPGGMMNPA